jgi:phage tail sheath protein FI
MPVALSYPGVYIEEVSSGVRTITGVATSITAFVGRAVRGDVNDPIRIQNYSEYTRVFGGLSLDSPMSYAVQQFFQTGGADALIVRVYAKPSTGDGVAVMTLGSGAVAAKGTLTVDTNPSDGDKMTIGGRDYIFDGPTLAAAQGTLTLAANPTGGDKMTIGGKTYTFKPTVAVADDIKIDPVLGNTQANIVTALSAHPDVATAAVFASDKLVLTAKTAGDAGNTIVTTSTNATIAFDDVTLGKTTHGADAGLTNVDGRIAIGTDVAATQKNIVGAINLTGAPGTQYAASTIAHPTVAAAAAFGASNDLVLTAKAAGTGGNGIGTAATFKAATNKFANATLSGGVASSPNGPGLTAANPGAWANNLVVRIDHQTRNPSDAKAFNLEIREIDPSLPLTAPAVRSERFLNVSVDPLSPLFVNKVLENRSKLARVGAASLNRPDPIVDQAFTGGSDGVAVGDNDLAAANLEGPKHGLWALEKADLFNLLCIPPLTRDTDVGALTRTAAEQYCRKRRAFFIVDPLSSWDEPSDLTGSSGVDSAGFGLARSSYAALFFPQIRSPDPLRDGQLETFAPCGAIAGIMARTDSTRGVWKAPAGIDATLNGVSELTVKLTDGENGQLNPIGINCLRSFPVIGQVVWGARTLRGADQLADEYKYIPVRRVALFIEESLYRGTQWVVFEPNDEPLWAQIRLNLGAFMNNLFRQGAFQGKTPREAYFVKCDKETTTQNDINLGIVNIIVGFAPLKPAEFVVIKIQQIAGQIAT